ncbi:MAG: segregation/condensation protein A [Methylobacterium sp.]|nr:segregation/condensation protein A [Methylobacterium sp.]MCA3596840.1 segregation/condensation protein A [Methylobacterium sp.]MCA3604576.1 segregation/condensation protein A [Methylobacterium sp.]MCA3605081.1 segregation/condensation protein A [Methylobacterium sp.]MCA3609457.1 segregation/condensation protein A [Methylobacterium sp.]
MAEPVDTSLDFEESVLVAGEDRDEGERLTVTLEGYEGPLDLLLDLARRNKLDLRAISILDLADQYLAYIQEARRLKLEVAGDYLVMGAWLAYLKSRLILPQRTNEADPEAVDLAGRLADRLQRLESIRRLGEMLGARLGDARESLPRGAGEAVIIERQLTWEASLQDLISAYAELRKVHAQSRYRIGTRSSVPIPEARNFVEGELARERDWATLDSLLARMPASRTAPRSARASAFAASLELIRDGRADARQEAIFAPLFLRRAERPPLPAEPAS